MTNLTLRQRRRRVLVVDDQEINREMLTAILEAQYDVLRAENGREALELIRANAGMLSLILLDLIMPEMDGFAVLETLRADEELRRIPVIVLTSEKNAELRSLQLGAVDFVTKPFDMYEVILARAARIIELAEGRHLIQAVERDALTGLYTGSIFFEYSQRMLLYRPETPMDALVLNIERFHLVNELYGREFGDRVLRTLSDKIRQFLAGDRGLACRMDADQFFIFCRRQDDYTSFLDGLREGLEGVSEMVRIRLRLGVCPVNGTGSLEQKFDRAKRACSLLRGNYTRSVLVYDDELHRKALYDQCLLDDIHRAIEQRQFQVWYQPKFDIRGEKPVLRSAEALVRWRHPKLGMISPGAFIPLFESNGLISLVDSYVWKETAGQLRRWKDLWGRSIPISVNLSRIDLYDSALEDRLLALLAENGLTAADLLLEITESAYAEDQEQLINVVQNLRRLGFLVEMDDFGSGYSSFNMLSSLPVDVLKLDMKFMQNLRPGSRDIRLIELILDIASFLEVDVVAEGVETDEQLALLKQSGCGIVQGYYFSKPLPPEEFRLFCEKEAAK